MAILPPFLKCKHGGALTRYFSYFYTRTSVKMVSPSFASLFFLDFFGVPLALARLLYAFLSRAENFDERDLMDLIFPFTLSL